MYIHVCACVCVTFDVGRVDGWAKGKERVGKGVGREGKRREKEKGSRYSPAFILCYERRTVSSRRSLPSDRQSGGDARMGEAGQPMVRVAAGCHGNKLMIRAASRRNWSGRCGRRV